MSSRANEAQVRGWIVALNDDANELLTEASAYLQRAPQDKALAERTGDIERGIAAELEASLRDRADAARYRALVALAEQARDYMDDDCMYAGALLQPPREECGTWVATQFVVQHVVPVAPCVARFVGDLAGLGATADEAIDTAMGGDQDE